eukprot:SAG11_NODE_486_length_9027_cov_2.681452_6_plen_61_part_00
MEMLPIAAITLAQDNPRLQNEGTNVIVLTLRRRGKWAALLHQDWVSCCQSITYMVDHEYN